MLVAIQLMSIQLRSRVIVSLFHKLTLLTQGNEENRTPKTLLFTRSDSWPISFGKDSF